MDDLQVWVGTGEDGDDFALFGEVTTDPELAGAVEKLRQVLAGAGLTQVIGD